MVKINRKILFLILAIFLLLALFFNVNNFTGFFYNALGNYNYNNADYKSALNYHKKAKNKIENNSINYNLGWDYYKLGDYDNSIKYYEKILSNTWQKEDLKANYNLWNAYFKLWKQENDLEKMIIFRKKSLENYKNILDKKNDKKTSQNYDYVKKKLEELEQEQKQEQKQDWWKPKNDTLKKEKQEDNTKNWEKKQDENATNENKSWEWNEYDIKKDSKLKELTEDEKRQLEEYNEQLKEQQKQNSKNFWKKSNSNQEDVFDIFSQDPFFGNYENFDNSILNWNEKDW